MVDKDGVIKNMEQWCYTEFLGVEYVLQKDITTENSSLPDTWGCLGIVSWTHNRPKVSQETTRVTVPFDASFPKVLSEEINVVSYSEIKSFWSQISLSVYHISLKTQICCT